MIRRRTALLVTATAVLAAPAAFAQTWPSKPIRLVVPFPAGGATDLLARAIAQAIGNGLGQPIVVDNRAGAGGTLGSGEVAKAVPDGHTLLIATSSTHSIAPHLNPNLPYNPAADFTPIAQVANATNLVLVPNSLPVANVREFIAYAKARPGQLNYATSGNGTIIHLTTEAFKAQAGVFVVHIPYRGTALAMPDLVSGKVHLLFDSVVTGLPHVKDGKLKALAITSAKRSALVPELPTLAESGLPGFESTTWFGFYGPKGLPNDITNRVATELQRAMARPDVAERLAKLGAEPVTDAGPAKFAAMVKADSARWAALIRERKITAE
ncbi:MAG TPA: tripartite tricarboxylate transporter substrate binding protein [Burkholderiaceae bacterium]|nr:tripartite tricarboxylate transporter substrate binding protein [Burkholderiaceae bacterium]